MLQVDCFVGSGYSTHVKWTIVTTGELDWLGLGLDARPESPRPPSSLGCGWHCLGANS
jgi:hypothetical protein